MSIMKNFRCSNQRCNRPFVEFISWQNETAQRDNFQEIPLKNLSCPYCNAKKPVMLVNTSVNTISQTTRNSDKNFKEIAQKHKLTDMGQRGGTQYGEPAIQMQTQPAATGAMYEPMPGFRVPYTGHPHAGWSDAPSQAKVKATPNQAVSRGGAIPTAVAGRTA